MFTIHLEEVVYFLGTIIVELVRAGKLYVNEDPTSRNLPSKVITEADLAAAEA